MTKLLIKNRIYNITHFFCLDLEAVVYFIAALIASSNTSSTPYRVKAEHSMYLTTLSPIDCILSPSSIDTVLPFAVSTCSLSFFKSNFVPTNIIGTSGQKCFSSGYHCMT